ncbi:MAG: histidine kinase, partial [Bacteroidota bacterium]
FVFIANLFFVLPMRKRLFINLAALAFLFSGIAYLPLAIVDTFVYGLEILGFTIPSFFIGNVQYRLKNDTFLNKRLLEEKNQSMQAANADLMMQSLQAQMNPHFIFNTLNSIQHFLVANDQQSSLTYLSRFARLIRLIFQHSKVRWIKLEEEIDFLQLYLQLEELRFENKIHTQFTVESSLEEMSQDWVVPPLLIQPLIENAFKHGLMHLEEGGQLIIQFLQEQSCLKCVIEDNGVGREKAKAYDEWRINDHRSSALEIIQQRLAMFNQVSANLGMTKEKLNQLRLIDLVNAQGEPQGTRIELTVCLQTQKILYERAMQNAHSTFGFPAD